MTSPAPASPSASPAALEVNSFSIDELLEKTESGCSILLKRSPDDADYIFHERLTVEGRGAALMKIEIPNATLKIQYQSEAVTALSAVGESGC